MVVQRGCAHEHVSPAAQAGGAGAQWYVVLMLVQRQLLASAGHLPASFGQLPASSGGTSAPPPWDSITHSSLLVHVLVPHAFWLPSWHVDGSGQTHSPLTHSAVAALQMQCTGANGQDASPTVPSPPPSFTEPAVPPPVPHAARRAAATHRLRRRVRMAGFYATDIPTSIEFSRKLLPT
jgi:hypothetical protein